MRSETKSFLRAENEREAKRRRQMSFVTARNSVPHNLCDLSKYLLSLSLSFLILPLSSLLSKPFVFISHFVHSPIHYFSNGVMHVIGFLGGAALKDASLSPLREFFISLDFRTLISLISQSSLSRFLVNQKSRFLKSSFQVRS